jgi:hypothetical protein
MFRILSAGLRQIMNIKVNRTVIGGKTVYGG